MNRFARLPLLAALAITPSFAAPMDRHPELKSRAYAWSEYDGSFLVDRESRAEMLDFFWTVMARPYPAYGWTGSTVPPVAGETSERWRLREYAQLNAIRALNYSQPLSEDAGKLPMVQAGALLLVLNNKWTHIAEPSWVWYNELAAEGIGSSNLGGVNSEGAQPYGVNKHSSGGLADGFVFDVGNDTYVGHRTDLLHDSTKKTSLGVAFGQFAGVGVWHTIRNSEDEFGIEPTRFIAWPAPGYFPYAPLRKNADVVRWSFALASADVSTKIYENAQIAAKVNGRPAPLVNVQKTGSISGITWGFDAADFDAAAAPDGTTIEITVSNLIGAPLGDTTVRAFHYAVKFFDEDTIVPVGYSPTTPLVNISTRGLIGDGDRQMITGFSVTGTLPVRIALRTQGPGLTAYGVTNPARKPRIRLYNSTGTLLGENSGWTQHQDWRLLKSLSLAPNDDSEAAMVASLWPGNYTAVVSDDAGADGVGIVEAFNIDNLSPSRLSNLSTRGSVGSNEQALIAGIVIKDTPRTVVIRTQGPGLARYGVSNPAGDTLLSLVDQATGRQVGSNDDWDGDPRNARLKSDLAHLAPSDSREAALVVTLQPGAYTALVSTKGSPGIGIVEVFDL